LSFPQSDGNNVWLWRPGVQFPDPQDFMERYVDHNVRVISQRIQIWANPTYLPESLQPRYDELWTEARMDRLIAAAVKNAVAVEINAHFQIPSITFLKRAKAAGAKFSFGSNRHAQGIGEIDYCLQTARECGLTSKDIYVPARDIGKP
jgi:histidinol phosphatase-like PHP family hydrolase